MLNWVATFLILALITAVLGFGGIATGAAGIAKILFFVFLVLVVISFITTRRISLPLEPVPPQPEAPRRRLDLRPFPNIGPAASFGAQFKVTKRSFRPPPAHHSK